MGNQANSRNKSSDSNGNRKASRGHKKSTKYVEPRADAYDKLVAWLVDMAAKDNVQLDASAMMRQIAKVSSVATDMDRPPTLRQHSASCDSNASSDITQRCNHSTNTLDDSLDPNFRFRPPIHGCDSLSDDDVDCDECTELISASNESLFNISYEGSDSDIILEEIDNQASNYEIANGTSNQINWNINHSSNVHVSSSADNFNSLSKQQKRARMFANSSRENVKIIKPKILDDSLLDGNIAEILYSVETMWPHK